MVSEHPQLFESSGNKLYLNRMSCIEFIGFDKGNPDKNYSNYTIQNIVFYPNIKNYN